MKKLWLVMFIAVCFCCALAAGVSQAGVAKPALTAAKKVSGLPTPKVLAEPVELSLTSPSFDGSSVAASARVPNAPRSFILDDNSTDNGLGIDDGGGGSYAFIWLNRFTPAAGQYPFNLTQVQVHFSSGASISVGDDIMLAIYENNTGNDTNPGNGSHLLSTVATTIQALDAWNVYNLATPVRFNGPGDVLIGVIALETPAYLSFPAAIDQTTSQQRSWIGWWTTAPPPTPPTLPPDSTWDKIDNLGFPGNWMIRGSGTAACIDNDSDTYGDNCTAGPDCDDNNSAVHVPLTYYRDADNDSYGNAATTSEVCSERAPTGFVTDNSDCDDTDDFYTDICPDCTVKIIPKTLGWLVGDKEKNRSLLVIGAKGTVYDESTEIKWESDAIDVIKTRVFFKRFMLMRAKFNGDPLEKQDYRVLVGECEGKISWAK